MEEIKTSGDDLNYPVPTPAALPPLFLQVTSLARYAKHKGNFVLVVSGSLEAERTKKFIEIVYDFLIKAIELGSFALLKFGVRPVGLK